MKPPFTEQQYRKLLRAWRVRRELTNKRLAERWGVSEDAIKNALKRVRASAGAM